MELKSIKIKFSISECTFFFMRYRNNFNLTCHLNKRINILKQTEAHLQCFFSNLKSTDRLSFNILYLYENCYVHLK